MQLNFVKAQSELLSAQLAEQKRRQEKLLSVLSDIVNRFKEGTILDATFSDASLDQFIARMGGIGSAATQGNNENDDGASAIPNAQQNLPEIPSHQTQQVNFNLITNYELLHQKINIYKIEKNFGRFYTLCYLTLFHLHIAGTNSNFIQNGGVRK